MDHNKIEQAITQALTEKGSKKFTQTVDLIVNLKELDLKKNDQQIDFFVNLPHSKGRSNKVCGLVGPELFDDAKKVLDHAIEAHEFENLKGKNSEIKKLAEQYDYFIAQATVMPKVAGTFGRILGSRGKMPNPKAGCVVPPKAQLAPLKTRLENTVRVMAKTSLSVKVPVGNESMDVKEIAANVEAVYKGITSHTVQGENNVKSVVVKLTMGKPARVE